MIDKNTPANGRAFDLDRDPEYQNLLMSYQAGNFHKCEHQIEELLKKYPGHPSLFKFREELALKLSVKALHSTIQKEEKKIKRTSTLSLSLVVLIGIIVILVTLFLSLLFFSDSLSLPDSAGREPADASTAMQLDLLYLKAEELLQAGQTEQVTRIIEIFTELRPDYPNLNSLQARLGTLSELEMRYRTAVNLVEEGEINNALEIFESIEAEQPGLWDVNQQIAAIEDVAQIESLLTDGHTAFQNEDWSLAINAYETLLLLNENHFDKTIINERLLTSYLNQMRQILTNPTLTVEEIESVEDYYQKAAKIISQNPAFAWANDELNQLNNILQAVKENNSHSPDTVTQTVCTLNDEMIGLMGFTWDQQAVPEGEKSPAY